MLFEGPWQDETHPNWDTIEDDDAMYFYDGENWWWLPPSTDYTQVKETTTGKEYVWAKAVRGPKRAELEKAAGR
jgi:hypothetical protein